MRRIGALTGPSTLATPELSIATTANTPLRASAVIAATSEEPTPNAQSPPKALVSIIPELCKGCELCVYACPSGNLTLSPGLNSKGYHPAVFSYNGTRGPCTACGICYWVCPDMAISEIRRLKQ